MAKCINLGHIYRKEGVNPMVKTEDYIIDKNGRKKAVILDIVEYEELLEDIESLALIADTRDEPKISFEEIKTRLRASGRL
jgi:hypothetical protein